MAQLKNKVVAVLGVVMIAVMLLGGFPCIEGRELKSEVEKRKNDVVGHVEAASYSYGSSRVRNSETETETETEASSPPPGRDVADFRPTAPGHSPGVGHSLNN